MGIVFTEKKGPAEGGRIIQACSANKSGSAVNALTIGADDVFPALMMALSKVPKLSLRSKINFMLTGTLWGSYLLKMHWSEQTLKISWP